MFVRLFSLLLLSVSPFLVSGCGSTKTGAARKPAQPERPRAYILAKDIHQWLDFDYQYNYSATDGGANGTEKSHDALLQNAYHFDTLYAVLRPKLLMGRLEMDVGFDGEWQKNETMGEDTGINPSIEYHLDGTFFKDEDYPVILTAITPRISSTVFFQAITTWIFGGKALVLPMNIRR